MTALDQALSYATAGLPVFPCTARKIPLVKEWPKIATCDFVTIHGWWTRWPLALIGTTTGPASGRNILDVDVKNPKAWGFDILDDLGFAILPVAPIAHTASGGIHIHFSADTEIRNTAGQRGRGIGPGLDWRGTGGYVILPSEGSGYWWDPHYGPDTPLAQIPPELLPREPTQTVNAKPVKPTSGLSPYAEKALDSACRKIIAAPNGEQEATLNSECFSIGTLAGASSIPAEFARSALLWAARKMPDYDGRHPWRPTEIERKIAIAFDAGLRRPREARHA